MSDAHPSLAPQWLKSGSLNLRPQTQSSTSAGSTDDVKGPLWRESGSRLGLGAGADRDAQGEIRQQSMLAPRRDKAAFPSDRGSARGYPTSPVDRRLSYPRPSNPNPHRQMSDRELVEQMPALKLRPGSRPGGDVYHDDMYKSPSSQKEADRLSRGRQQGSARKPQGSQRPTPLGPSRGDKEAPSHLKPPTQKTGSGGMPSPRHLGSDQPWTSRLADVGGSALQTVPDPSYPGQGPSISSALQKAEPPAKPVPRMADTILQAQASAAQELEAAKSAKARKEQLALKQSKQLIPVISTKAKHASGAASHERPQLTSLKKPMGLEPLGKIPVSAHGGRRDEDSGTGPKSVPSAGPPKPGQEYSASTASPKAMTLPGKPARERDRMTFFSSLRRKATGNEQHGNEENGSLFRQASSNASDAASAGDTCSPKRTSARGAQDSLSTACKAGAVSNGRHDDEPKMTPEELAFMRSLGWEDSGDDTGGGLTEEEVAAFKARQPPAKTAATQKACPPPQDVLSHDSKFATTAENVNKKQQLSRSFHSELEFSDSDSQ